MNKPNNYGSKKPFPSRRLVIGAGVGAVAAAAWWGWPRVAPYLVGDFEFEPVPGVPGFRQIAGGDTSGNINPLAGIEAPGSGKNAESVLPFVDTKTGQNRKRGRWKDPDNVARMAAPRV